jgi:rhomboid protease GluP
MAGRGRWLSGAVLALSLTLLITHIPAPRYRWSEEVQARGEINEFIGEDARLSARWSAILGRARKENATFDEVAGRIESEVSSPYAQSFEQLSKLRLDATAPSAAALEKLRSYAELRRDASRELVKGLRAKDPVRIREALEMATRKAPQNANGKKPADTSAAP